MQAGSSRHRQAGITYLWVLFLVFLLGLGLGKSLEVYSFLVQREKEADTRYAQEQYERARQAYFDNSPGYQGQYPSRMEDLLLDPRHLGITRYLRKPPLLSTEP